MDVFNETRLKVWQQQGPEFFEEAVIDADGTMVETTGECKEGMDINHKGQWGYHPLAGLAWPIRASRLFIVNRPGNRPSHEGAARVSGPSRRTSAVGPVFARSRLRGDTDFTQTEHLDAWDEDGVTVRVWHRRHAQSVRNRGKPAAKCLATTTSVVPNMKSEPSPAHVRENVKEANRRAA